MRIPFRSQQRLRYGTLRFGAGYSAGSSARDPAGRKSKANWLLAIR
jgi:hypothetical protein